MATVIVAEALTTFEISPHGERVRFNVRDTQGESSSLDLPAATLNQLLMTLPKVIQEALRRNQGEEQLRLAYPMDAFSLELGDVGEDGIQRYLLTMKTDRAFEITFSLQDSLLGHVAQTIIDQVLDSGQAVLEPVPLNS